jgi:hypothetical protein
MAPERDRSRIEAKVTPGETKGGFMDTYNREWLVGKKVSSGPARSGRNGSPRPRSPWQLNKNLCPENRMRNMVN